MWSANGRILLYCCKSLLNILRFYSNIVYAHTTKSIKLHINSYVTMNRISTEYEG